MGGRRYKRKMKRAVAESEESTKVVKACLGICTVNGIAIDFPWQLPQVFAKLIAMQHAAAATGGANGVDTFDRLAEGSNFDAFGTTPPVTTSAPTPTLAQATPPPPPPTGPSIPKFPGSNQTKRTVHPPAPGTSTLPRAPNAGLREIRTALTGPVPAPAGTLTPRQAATAAAQQAMGDDQNQAAMMQQFEAKQAAMMGRIEQNGVTFKNGQGPEGFKQGIPMQTDWRSEVSPAQKQAPTAQQPATQQQTTPRGRINLADMGTVGNGAPSSTPQTQGESPGAAPSHDGGRVNMHSGLTRDQQADVIAKATGKRPGHPGGGAVLTGGPVSYPQGTN